MNKDAEPPVNEAEGIRLRLLEIAEALFADLGVESTPLQRIVEESGQRNRSALNYHFGSRRDLLGALMVLRMRQVNTLRHEKLNALAAAGSQADIRQLTRAFFDPLIEIVHRESWGRHYAQILAQCMFDPGMEADELITAEVTTALRAGHDFFVLAMPDAPVDVIATRLIWANDVLVYSIARWCRDGIDFWGSAGPLEDMFDFIEAGLRAPVSLRSGRSVVPPAPTGMGRWLDKALDAPKPAI